MSTGARPALRVYDEWAIRRAVNENMALAAMDAAFRTLARGQASVPPPLSVEFPEVHGEIHVKGAHLAGSASFVFKVATGFYGNIQFGMPTGAGFVMVFDAETGFPRAILQDNGYLTDVRTAAAGAIAVEQLTPRRPLEVAVLGAGVQARMQVQFAARVRTIASVRVWSRSGSHAEDYVQRMSESLGVPVKSMASARETVSGADLVVTATPSRRPIVLAEWLRPGVTVIAVGSDGPDKIELEPALVAGADKVVTDLTRQCVKLGELHHAVEAELMSAEDVHAELGQILEGERSGREGDETIVCDLTGVGAQDAAIGEAAYHALTGTVPEPVTP
jgi:ornithine cyclodeaminase